MPQRYLIVAMTALASFWLYIDRVCFSTLARPIKEELLLPHAASPAAADSQMSYALGAFFLTYAIFQIPMGSLADRYGARKVLALSIAAWSFVTMVTGFVSGFAALLAIRLLLGVTEAGAYPAAAGLIKSWVAPGERGRSSAAVTLGGRLGGAVAPWLTATLAAALAGAGGLAWLAPGSATAWRGVFVIYGLCGLAVAALFWLIVRDRPAGTSSGAAATATDRGFVARLGILARTANMWNLGILQFCVNLGWAFIVTLLPTYLAEVFGTPLEKVGAMQSTALAIGCVGMLFGGGFTDFMLHRLGPRLGRSVPIGLSLAGCAVAFFAVPTLPSAWLVIVALGAMAFCVDMHNPPLWSFVQDIGGSYVGTALGWGNLWGNLGAALSPILLTELRRQGGWNTAFICCGCACVLGAICGFMLDATRPVEPEAAPANTAHT